MKQTEEGLKLRKLLAANIKERRGKLALSQEKLAELADVSVQTVNFIEGCRTWVSDKTLAKLAGALHIDAYRLLLPEDITEETGITGAHSRLLSDLRRMLKSDIDKRFDDAGVPE